MNEWWKTFFDEDYVRIARQVFKQEDSTAQAAALWSMLDLSPGCRLLDAPCGWGRLSRPLAALGATVLGVDQSEILLRAAETQRGETGIERLRYVRHDLREPLPEENFDVACNIFTSFGYGPEEEDLALFRTLRGAVRPGGRVLVETSHRDLFCASLARSTKTSIRLADGTIFSDEPEFDPISELCVSIGIGLVRWVQGRSTQIGAVILRRKLYGCSKAQDYGSWEHTKGFRKLHTEQKGQMPVEDSR